jgi:hypothetical protein
MNESTTRRGLRQKARRRARVRAGENEVLFQDLYWQELLALGVAGDARKTPKPTWWKPGQSPNRWSRN